MKKQFVDRSEKDLVIGYHTISCWEENFGLPIHLFDAFNIRNNIKSFNEVFRKYYQKGEVRYAAKACCHRSVFKIALEENTGTDVASFFETKCAIESGIPYDKIVLNGNCKEDELIEEAIGLEILIAADSIEEFILINEIARKLGKKANVIIRVSGFDLGNITASAIFTGGTWSKFGASISDVPQLISELNKYEFVNLLGFHSHIGSQITEPEPYLIVLGKLIELSHLLKKGGREVKFLNLGGGFPVSYLDKSEWESVLEKIKFGYTQNRKGDSSKIHVWNNNIDLFALDNDLNPTKYIGEKFYTQYPKEKMLECILTSEITVNGKTIKTTDALKEIGEPLFLIEPGRSIIDDSAITLAKVSQVRKAVSHHNLITLEMGITNIGTALLSPVLNKWEIANDHDKKDNESFETFVAGNLCFSGDMISRIKINLQRKPCRGNILAIHNTGAYNPNFLSSNANSYPRPARILIYEDEDFIVMKDRDTYEDIFSL